jgi:hypothetical protein
MKAQYEGAREYFAHEDGGVQCDLLPTPSTVITQLIRCSSMSSLDFDEVEELADWADLTSRLDELEGVYSPDDLLQQFFSLAQATLEDAKERGITRAGSGREMDALRVQNNKINQLQAELVEQRKKFDAEIEHRERHAQEEIMEELKVARQHVKASLQLHKNFDLNSLRSDVVEITAKNNVLNDRLKLSQHRTDSLMMENQDLKETVKQLKMQVDTLKIKKDDEILQLLTEVTRVASAAEVHSAESAEKVAALTLVVNHYVEERKRSVQVMEQRLAKHREGYERSLKDAYELLDKAIDEKRVADEEKLTLLKAYKQMAGQQAAQLVGLVKSNRQHQQNMDTVLSSMNKRRSYADLRRDDFAEFKNSGVLHRSGSESPVAASSPRSNNSPMGSLRVAELQDSLLMPEVTPEARAHAVGMVGAFWLHPQAGGTPNQRSAIIPGASPHAPKPPPPPVNARHSTSMSTSARSASGRPSTAK